LDLRFAKDLGGITLEVKASSDAFVSLIFNQP